MTHNDQWWAIRYFRKTGTGGMTTTLWAPTAEFLTDAVAAALRDGATEITATQGVPFQGPPDPITGIPMRAEVVELR